MTDPLPIDFFTIVINGEPFIRHHIEVFKRLGLSWTWHIIEGLAAHRHDTSWGAKNGGRLPAKFLTTARSDDGTSSYLDALAAEYPDQVKIYRKPPGVCWDGKLEMVSAPVPNIRRKTLLWQVDADELWTVDQIQKMHSLFTANPARTAAWFLCHFFVNPEFCSSATDVYGNFTKSEWLRVWRFEPGDQWTAHEPPTLMRTTARGPVDIGRMNPFSNKETDAAGLRFQHFAYALEAQVRFKEDYYGYRDAVKSWENLQNALGTNPKLRDYLPWVREVEIGTARTLRTLRRKVFSPFSAASRASAARSEGIVPLAQENAAGGWKFLSVAPPEKSSPHIVLVRTDRIGDHLLFFGFLPPLRSAFPTARITLAYPKDVAGLLPYRSILNEVVEFDRERGHRDAGYRKQIVSTIERVPVDLLICPQYSRDNLANKISTTVRAGRRVGFASESTLERASHVRKHNQYARKFDTLVPVSSRDISELEKYRELLRALKIHEPLSLPFYQPADGDIAKADALIGNESLAGRRLIAIFPGAANELRTIHQLGAALRDCPRINGFALVGLGDAAHRDLIETTIRDSAMPGINLAGQTTLPIAAAVMKRCELGIGADTGLAHLACATGLKNVVLLGGGDFGRFFPYSPLTTVVALPLTCFYCHFDCRQPEPYCLTAIPAKTISAAITHALARQMEHPELFVPGKDSVPENLKSLSRDAKSLAGKFEIAPWIVHQI